MGTAAANLSNVPDTQDGSQIGNPPPTHRLIGLVGGNQGEMVAATADLQPTLDKVARLVTMLLTSTVPVAALLERGASLKTQAKDLAITDRNSFTLACELGLLAKALQADAEGSAIEDLKALAHSVHKDLTALLSRLTKDPKGVEEFMKKQLVGFCREEAEEHRLRELERHAVAVQAAKERRAREVAALRSAERHAEADRVEARPLNVPFMPQPYETDPVPGVSITVTGYKPVIVDEALVPDELKRTTTATVVDLPAVEALAEATGYSTDIPGIEFVPDYRVAMSAR